MSIQGKAVKRAVLPAVFVVSAAWWMAFSIYEAVMFPGWFFANFDVLAGHAWKTMLMVAYGAGAGAILALFLALTHRQDREAALAGESIRNLTTTMGTIPLVAKEPPRSAVAPNLRLYAEEGEKIAAWLKVLAKVSPAHARLTEALLMVFNSDPTLPATHIPGGHGGASLLKHSLLVTQVILEMAPSWAYEGLKNKKGDITIALRNPVYKFNPVDPIIGIVALSHDLGKMECYIKDPSGKVVDSRHAHDVVSGRMIARLPEFWGIPKEDRDAIVLAISYYHHPQDLPMHEDGRALDDRTIAVMELLIKADKAAGKVESGTTYENTMGDTEPAEDAPATRLIDDEVLYNAFIEIIHEPGRINGKDSATRVGQKHGGLLYFAESSLRVALIRKLGMSTTPVLGDGRSALTVQLMELLADRGLLMQEFQGRTYSFKRAMFRVAFFNSRNGKHLADWPAVLIVNPGVNMPQITSMKDHLSRVEITRPVWGESSAVSKVRTPPVGKLNLDSGEAENEESFNAAMSGPAEDEIDAGGAPEGTAVQVPVVASPAAPSDDDLIGDLMGNDPLSRDEEASQMDEQADDEAVPDIQEDEADLPPAQKAPEDGAVDSFNRIVKKLGGNKPLSGLDKGHLEKLGDKLNDGVEAALADLEKKSTGHPYSRAMLLVERKKLEDLLKKGAITLYKSPQGELLALDEVISARGRFGWNEAVSEAEAGEQDVFSVVHAGERVYLKFVDFQKNKGVVGEHEG